MLNRRRDQQTPGAADAVEGSAAARDFVLAENIAAAPESEQSTRFLPRWRRSGRSRPGVPLILLSADVVAFSLAVALNGVVGPKTVALFGIIVLLFHAGGLYRPRLSFSLLDDA